VLLKSLDNIRNYFKKLYWTKKRTINMVLFFAKKRFTGND
jgi:hypothetical protein